jgi:hypothetical protein
MIKRFAKLKAGSKFLFPEPLLAGRRAEKAKEWLSLGGLLFHPTRPSLN